MDFARKPSELTLEAWLEALKEPELKKLQQQREDGKITRAEYGKEENKLDNQLLVELNSAAAREARGAARPPDAQQDIAEQRRREEAQRAAHIREIKDKDPEAHQAIAEVVNKRDARAAAMQHQHKELVEQAIEQELKRRQSPSHTLALDGRPLGTTEAWDRRQLETTFNAASRHYGHNELEPYNKEIDRLREDFRQKDAVREQTRAAGLHAALDRSAVTRDRQAGRYDALSEQHGREARPSEQERMARERQQRGQDIPERGQERKPETPAERVERLSREGRGGTALTERERRQRASEDVRQRAGITRTDSGRERERER